MECPNCGGAILKVAVSFSGDVACRFGGDGAFQIIDAVELDSSMSDDAACRCPDCGWQGEFWEAGDAAPVSAANLDGPITPEELADLVSSTRRFTGESKRVATRLAGEVRRLNLLLDAVSRLSTDGSLDTKIG